MSLKVRDKKRGVCSSVVGKYSAEGGDADGTANASLHRAVATKQTSIAQQRTSPPRAKKQKRDGSSFRKQTAPAASADAPAPRSQVVYSARKCGILQTHRKPKAGLSVVASRTARCRRDVPPPTVPEKRIEDAGGESRSSDAACSCPAFCFRHRAAAP